MNKFMRLRTMSHYVDEALDELVIACGIERTWNEIDPFRKLRSKLIICLAGLHEHEGYGELLDRLRIHDEYTYRHSIGVAVIARWIGHSMNISDSDLQELTEAALLHDIGKLEIPGEILRKPECLTEEEFCLIRLHSEYGRDLLLAAEAGNERYAIIAAQHHEREDGSGYPANLTGERIDYWSKIIAVADVFHAMVSKRSYKQQASALKVMIAMEEDEFGALAPDIVACLQRKVMSLMLGTGIRLSNGTSGRIVMIPYHDPTHPVVEIGGRLVELSKRSDLRIEDMNDQVKRSRVYGSSIATE